MSDVKVDREPQQVHMNYIESTLNSVVKEEDEFVESESVLYTPFKK